MVRLRILILLLALASVLVTSSLGQGFVSFYGIRCGEVFEVFPDLRFDEQEPDAHYRAQLQFDDGRPIGDPIRLECSGFWGYPRQVVQGVAVGDSARIRVVVLNAANEVIAGRSAVPIVLGEEFRPADLSALLRTVDRERPSGGEDPKQSGLSLWVDSDPVVNSEDLIPTFGPRILWIPTGDLFGTDRPLLTHSGLRGPVAWGDLDGDGDLDFISLGNSVSYRCFLQQPDRTFLLREGISTGAGANGIALAEFDGYDDLDAWVYQGVANDRGIQNALWLNQ